MKRWASKGVLVTPSEPQGAEWCKFANEKAFIVGCWKFLERSPYRGHTDLMDDPVKWLTFIKNRGYATDPLYIGKVLKVWEEVKKKYFPLELLVHLSR